MKNKVDDYIDKQKSPQKEICEELRQIIFDIFPNIQERMNWGVPAYGNDEFYIVALKDHVNLGFTLKNLSEENKKLFDGSGKTMVQLEISSLDKIDKKRITKLLNLAKQK